MTFASAAVGYLSAISPLLFSVAALLFLCYAIAHAVKIIKKLVIAQSFVSNEKREKAEAKMRMREEYYNKHLSYDARKEKQAQERFEKAHAKWNAKVNGQIKREQEEKDYQSWKEAHRSFERYFEGKEFQEKHVDTNGFIVVDDEDLAVAGSWQTDRGDEFPDVERFDRQDYYVEKREEGSFLVRSEQTLIEFSKEKSIDPDYVGEFVFSDEDLDRYQAISDEFRDLKEAELFGDLYEDDNPEKSALYNSWMKEDMIHETGAYPSSWDRRYDENQSRGFGYDR